MACEYQKVCSKIPGGIQTKDKGFCEYFKSSCLNYATTAAHDENSTLPMAKLIKRGKELKEKAYQDVRNYLEQRGRLHIKPKEQRVRNIIQIPMEKLQGLVKKASS